jgi:hypothetical protein
MVLSHEEQNISDKDKKKKVKFSGFKKAVQVLSGTSKKEKKQKEETNTFNPVYVPNVPNHETQANVQPTRRLSVTHMRSLFEAAPLPNITSTQKQVSEIKPGGNIEAKPDMLKPGILKHGILKPWSSVKKADTSVSQARPNPSLGRPLPVIRTEESVTRSSSVKDLKRLFEGQVEPTIKAPEVKAEVKHSVGSRHQGQKMSRTISLYGLPNYARDESEDGLQEEQDELDSFYAAKQPRSSKVVKSVSTSKKPGTEKGGTATTTLRQRFVNRFGPKEKLD